MTIDHDSLVRDVEIVDVTLRDGLQLLKDIVPTERKLMLLSSLVSSGLRRIEIGSFVNPKLLPQFNDTRLMIHAAKAYPQVRTSVLIPNRRGFEIAAEAGADELIVVVSASELHNKANLNRSIDGSLEEIRPILVDGKAAGTHIRIAVATAFHCPFAGPVPHENVLRIIDDAMTTGALSEILLGDTIGKATPPEVEALIAVVRSRYPGLLIGIHAHDTYGRGVANALAAVKSGARVIDGALAGLGGCPYAPGAAGNVATDDLAVAMEVAGLQTGLDKLKLGEASKLATTFGLPCRVPPINGAAS
jgi:hydroxymethylglutaryl-CoA lyase